jgi:hypothetical protein
MPVLRYFLYVGGALLTLLLVANALLGQQRPASAVVSSAETPVIRIHSDKKWPEAVVFDTSQPTIAPAPVSVAKANAAPVAPTAVTEASPKAHVREAFAQLPPSEQTSPVDTRKPEAKRHLKHKVARARPMQPPWQQPPMMMASQQPHFGWFGNTW